VTGWDPEPGAAASACDVAARDLASAVAGADLVVVACPLDALPERVAESLAAAGQDAVVTDVGSAKTRLCSSIDDPRFIGGHPMAGAETAGVQHARSDLFHEATWYLTPDAGTEGIRLERLTRFITGIGARPRAIEPAAHDRLMAAVSHLPHVLANVLVDGVGDEIASAGPSFRDATRVAGANPPLWRSIYLENSEALAAAIDDAIERLTHVRGLLGRGDGDSLQRWQEQAAQHRSQLGVALAGEEVEEVRVVVPNRPGVLADLALALGRDAINIYDLSLSPSADNSSGEVALWVPSSRAQRARALIDEVVAG
jgi:prephenate dehydrogenase